MLMDGTKQAVSKLPSARDGYEVFGRRTADRPRRTRRRKTCKYLNFIERSPVLEFVAGFVGVVLPPLLPLLLYVCWRAVLNQRFANHHRPYDGIAPSSGAGWTRTGLYSGLGR